MTTDVQPIEHFSITAENQDSGLDDKYDNDEFKLQFSLDDLFTDEHGIIGDAFGTYRKDDGVVVGVLEQARVVDDGNFDCSVGDRSRNTSGLSRETSTQVYGNAASGSDATDASDLNYMPNRKNESEDGLVCLGTEDEKRKARLKRNRESAQMSRERKKHYVEELEDKVRVMHATIADLNRKFSYFMSENVSLRQQLGGGMMCAPVTSGNAYPRFPMVPMGYSWMSSLPYASNGTHTHVLPIMSVEPQSSVQSSKSTKLTGYNSGSKKTEVKIKKVASISLLGLLVFVFLFGGLVPMMTINYGGRATSVRQNMIFTVKGKHETTAAEDENLSQPLVASLYVPRKEKLVKIDGNLIIRSVLAREKAMSSQETMRLAGTENVAPSKASADDPQEWYHDGAAGTKLISCVCTEVFQFDTSRQAKRGAVVPVTSARNISTDQQTSDQVEANLHSLHNVSNMTEEHMESKYTKNSFDGNQTSIVVSVHIDPKETSETLPRILVVVLLERVSYVTYSCVIHTK